MKKISFILFIFLIHISSFSQDFNFFFNTGSMNLTFLESNTAYTKLSLPSVYLLEKNSNTGVFVKPLSINLTDLEKDILTTYISTNIFWSPINKDSFFIGPYINLELINTMDISSSVGIQYHHFLPEKYNLLSKIRIRAVDIEAGYNISNELFYSSIDIDLLVLFALWIGITR